MLTVLLIVLATWFVVVGFGPLLAVAIAERRAARATRDFVAMMESAWGER